MNHEFWMWEGGAVSSDLCDSWVARFDKGLESGLVGAGDGKRDDEIIRRSKIKFVEDKDVMDALSGFVNAANRMAFGVDISNFIEMQFTKYEAEDKGFYDWHSDTFLADREKCFHRKLSVVVALSNPDDYEGGDFYIGNTRADPIRFQKGSVIVFPSIVIHKVSPVTKGTRYTMVGWMEGPKWR